MYKTMPKDKLNIWILLWNVTFRWVIYDGVITFATLSYAELATSDESNSHLMYSLFLKTYSKSKGLSWHITLNGIHVGIGIVRKGYNINFHTNTYSYDLW